MIIELISVGTELLLGNITNTNAVYLARKCAELGLDCYYQDTVGDNEERLEATIKQAVMRSDIVLLGGGLGPTKDDLTKEIASKVMGEALVEDVCSLEKIEKYFQARGLKMAQNNRKQALKPEHAIVIDNENGTAPGYIIEKDGKHVVLMPGPPNEFIPMFERDILPYLAKLGSGLIYSKMVKICGIGESSAEEMIADLIHGQTNPTLATYAKTGEVHIRVTARADKKENAKKLVKPVVEELKKRFGKKVYATKEEISLEESCYKLLYKNNLTLTAAESCTGGLLAGRLINVSGVSEVLKASFVTYSDEQKHNLLGVHKMTLKKYTAVSKEVASEMAIGAAKAVGADVALSITGIAGPDGGTEKIPVGTVYIGCYVKGNVKVKKFNFRGSRAKIREWAVAEALTLLRMSVLKNRKK